MFEMYHCPNHNKKRIGGHRHVARKKKVIVHGFLITTLAIAVKLEAHGAVEWLSVILAVVVEVI